MLMPIINIVKQNKSPCIQSMWNILYTSAFITELGCGAEPIGVATVVAESLDDIINNGEIGIGVGYVEPETTTVRSTTTSTTKETTKPTTTTSTTTTTTSRPTTQTTRRTTTIPSTTPITTTRRPEITTTVRSTRPTLVTTTRRGSVVVSRSTIPPWSQPQRPIVLGPPVRPVQEVIVRSAHRQDNSVIIQWDSETANILGFRVVYRLFGDKSFKQGPPLEASEREFKIKNVPSQVNDFSINICISNDVAPFIYIN